MNTLATVLSRATVGISAPLVTVEVHVANGLPGLAIVGLPEAAVRESKERVKAALVNCQFRFPDRRITVNLAPADLPKEGGRFDLAIAIGILLASGQLKKKDAVEGIEFFGELSLGGELRSVRALLPALLSASAARHSMIVPSANAAEASLMESAHIWQARHLLEICAYLNGEAVLETSTSFTVTPAFDQAPAADLQDVRGQAYAKRALEIAAAGGHSLLFFGPPGSGKSMLAQRFNTLLPELSKKESMECAAIASISSSGFHSREWRKRPFRSPHHGSSVAALIGGGGGNQRILRPGEISLAHHGTLFLDELPEFSHAALEALREPLETGQVHLSRAMAKTTYPAGFQLIAAMNPCPCGYLGNVSGRCHCSSEQIARYRRRLSGPLWDRIDMHVEVGTLSASELLGGEHDAESGESSAVIKKRVMEVREHQLQRQGVLNAGLNPQRLEHEVVIDPASRALLLQAMDHFQLSARAAHRILRLAYTIMDMAGQAEILPEYIAEALSYRQLDRDRA